MSMVRITTEREDWPWKNGITDGIPELPTGETYEDENGDEQPIYQGFLAIGPGADEFPGIGDNEGTGRIWAEDRRINSVSCDYLIADGRFTITRPGTFEGDEYPFPEETP